MLIDHIDLLMIEKLFLIQIMENNLLMIHFFFLLIRNFLFFYYLNNQEYNEFYHLNLHLNLLHLQIKFYNHQIYFHEILIQLKNF